MRRDVIATFSVALVMQTEVYGMIEHYKEEGRGRLRLA
jgi:hypothetical protein